MGINKYYFSPQIQLGNKICPHNGKIRIFTCLQPPKLFFLETDQYYILLQPLITN